MGNVQYRRGEIPESEVFFIAAKKSAPNLVDAYLGLARVYRTALLYRRAYDQINRAHEIAPQNPGVQRAWITMLPRRERLQALETDWPDHTRTRRRKMRPFSPGWNTSRRTADQPVHACKLVNNVEKTETEMAILLRDAQHIAGYGLSVKINDHNERLLLDTGASGIIINRRAAEKAGLKRISSMQFTGIGDKGQRDAYYALVDQVRIGELEFKGLLIIVLEKSMGLDEDGLVGADVFSSYVVDIDIPGDMLRLTPLPRKRPEEAQAKASLASEPDADSEAAEQPEATKDAKTTEKSTTDNSAASSPVPRIPITLCCARNGAVGQDLSNRSQPADADTRERL